MEDNEKVFGFHENFSKVEVPTLKQVIETIYPVGSIYISLNNTSPATLFGGTWERIKGYTLAGINEEDTDKNSKTSFNQEAGTKIGSKFMMGHYHNILFKQNGDIDYEATYIPGNVTWTYSGQYYEDNTWKPRVFTTRQGGQGDAENIQPTLLVYMWKRTA